MNPGFPPGIFMLSTHSSILFVPAIGDSLFVNLHITSAGHVLRCTGSWFIFAVGQQRSPCDYSVSWSLRSVMVTWVNILSNQELRRCLNLPICRPSDAVD